jgi:uncharacterized protein (TIGR00266 family)
MAVEEWYYIENNAQAGPLSLNELLEVVKRKGADTPVFGPGMADWTPARRVPEIGPRLGLRAGPAATPPPINYAAQGGGSRAAAADVIDYQIFGEEMQYVEITLDPGETVLAEAGVMMYMTTGIKMETVFGDPSAQNQSVWGKIASAGKRMITGESLFVTTFQAISQQREVVAFASPYPGKIIPLHLDQHDGEIICQKDSFVCAARGIQIGIAFQKKIGVGLFGGEGFIMQRLTGDGIALVHAGGTIMSRTLKAGETIKLDTGCLVALEKSITYDIQFIGGFKNAVFGGEGLFIATVTGPGKVWLQSLPFSRLAGRVLANASSARGGKDEGSLLGGLGGIGLGGLLGDAD